MNSNGTKHLSLKRLLILSGIAAAVFMVFRPTLSLPFFWDDQFIIRSNHRLENPWNIFRAFYDQEVTVGGLGSLAAEIYRPLRTVLFILVVSLFGKSPGAFHAVALSMHLAVTYGLFSAMRKTDKRLGATAGWLSLAFLFHPVHLENLNAAFGVADILGALFFLGALGCVPGNGEGKIRGAKPLAIAAFCYLAMLSKESLVPAPLVLFLLFPGRLEKRGWAAVLFTIPVYLLQRWAVVRALGQTRLDMGAAEHAMYVFQTFRGYLELFVNPASLSQVYLPPSPLLSWKNACAFFLFVFFTAAFIMLLRRRRIFLGSEYAALTVSLLPVLNLVPINTFINDRLLYFPSLVIVYCLFRVIRKTFAGGSPGISRRVFRTALVFWVAGLAALAWHRNREWSRPELIWEKSWRRTGRPIALWNMTVSLWERERYAPLLDFYSENPVSLPVNYHPYYYRILCVSAGRLGRADDFVFYYRAFENALSRNPGVVFDAVSADEFERELEALSLPPSKDVLERYRRLKKAGKTTPVSENESGGGNAFEDAASSS